MSIITNKLKKNSVYNIIPIYAYLFEVALY